MDTDVTYFMNKVAVTKENLYKIQQDVGDSFSSNIDDENANYEVSVRVSNKRAYLPPNIMVFQSFAMYIAVNIKEPSVSRLLLYLLGISAYENYLSIDIKTLSNSLKLNERSVIRSLNTLVELNVVIKLKHPIDKRRHDYFINPLSAWKGNSYARNKKIKELEKYNKSQLELGYNWDTKNEE